jgi:hypothetical protein
MGDRDRIFDRGPVKSNLISQELLQDLPRGESRIQLLPDKTMAELGLQCRSRPYGGQGSYNTDGLAASNDANVVQPRNLLSSF